MLDACKLLGWLVRTNNRQAGYLFYSSWVLRCRLSLCFVRFNSICSIFPSLSLDFSSPRGCLYVYSFYTFYFPFFAFRFFCLPYWVFLMNETPCIHLLKLWRCFSMVPLGFLSMWCNKNLTKDKFLNNSNANNWDSITYTRQSHQSHKQILLSHIHVTRWA